MYENRFVISLGNFLFRYRNFIFPVMLLFLFVVVPPSGSFLGTTEFSSFKDLMAVLVCGLGLAVRATVIGFAYIKRGGLNKQVYADELVTNGIFAICRNPLYVGNVIIYFGIFLMHGNMNMIFFGTLLFIFIYISLIAAEENFLRKKFGAQFEEYCARTPRWMPVLSELRTATHGMSFDYKKVVLKDYTTVANTLFALICIKIYELVAGNDYVAAEITAALIPVLVVALIIIKRYKKKSAAANMV